MRKCEKSGDDFHMSLLEWMNTPTEGIVSSPIQRLMGRRTRTQLPVNENKLHEKLQPKKQVENLENMKRKQAMQYNKGSHNLEELKEGETVRI